MDLLLDTHVFLWWDRSDSQLGEAAAAEIGDPANKVFISAASVWEIAIKRQSGRLAFARSPSQAIAENGFFALPISGEHGEAAAGLPAIHKDPFDRILIAQATVEGIILLTADPTIARYPGPIRKV